VAPSSVVHALGGAALADERDMEAELRFHIEAFAEDSARAGVAREEALRRARIEFGGIEHKKECREARGPELRVDTFLPSSPAEAERLGVTEIDRYQATEYYRASRGQKPHGATKSLFSHMSVAVGWDAFQLAECMMVRASARR
jgi:hypothetical protein